MRGNAMSNNDAVRRDAEKNWHDPAMFRAAARYVFAVIALAAAAFAATVTWHSMLAAILVPAVLFGGTIGALVRTFHVWRDGGMWVMWQGAAWILAVLFLFCLGVPAAIQ